MIARKISSNVGCFSKYSTFAGGNISLSSVRVPVEMIFPPCRMAIRSASCSASSRYWVVSRIVVPPPASSLTVSQTSIRASDHVRQSISLTGQFAALDGMLTGRENLLMIAKLRGVSNPAQVADNLLARFSLTDAANRRADKYSGGMKRRLDIAMSLIGTPAVIFLDEPTTGLDSGSR